jgi:hypothetical protein
MTNKFSKMAMTTPFKLVECAQNADVHISDIFEGRLNHEMAVSTILEFILKMELGTDFLAKSKPHSTQLNITKSMAQAFLAWHPRLWIATSIFFTVKQGSVKQPRVCSPAETALHFGKTGEQLSGYSSHLRYYHFPPQPRQPFEHSCIQPGSQSLIKVTCCSRYSSGILACSFTLIVYTSIPV